MEMESQVERYQEARREESDQVLIDGRTGRCRGREAPGKQRAPRFHEEGQYPQWQEIPSLTLSPGCLVHCQPQAPCHALEKLAKINLYLLCIHSVLFRETVISLSSAWAWP